MRPPRPARVHRPATHMVLSARWRVACTVLAIVPVPGVGVLIAGWKNPHSRLLSHGVLQTMLVVFGSYPLIIPGLVGLAWAAVDALRIHRARVPDRWSTPTKVQD